MEMTGTDKMALNTLYNCETVSSRVIMQYLKEENTRVKREFKQMKNKPFVVQCAWQDYWKTPYSVITFDRITYEAFVGGSGGNGGLDINTGVFTVGFSGVWAVTYSIQSWQYSGEYNQAWLFINGERIAESYHNTEYYDSCCGQYEGHIQSLGSRTLYMRLESGDTVSLRSGTVGHGLYQVTLCFQLAQVDS